jgi:very-short-patch-repair endonuclease
MAKKSILETHPEVAAQWHPTKNGDLKPENFTRGSGRKVWWLCPKTCPEGCLHEYQSIVNQRCNKNSGCQYCVQNTMKICKHMSIEYTHPNVAKLWHPTKNGTLLPSNVTVGCHTKIWWLCPKKCSHGCCHEWQTSIHHLATDTGCPYCSNRKLCEHMSIAYTHPEIASEWHPTKNKDLDINLISSGSSRKVWWLCPRTCKEGCLHEYQQVVHCKTISNQGCPYCSITNKKFCSHNSIEYTHPHILSEWDCEQNKNPPSKYTFGTNAKVHWICKQDKNHKYIQAISSRTTKRTGCPFCKHKTELLLLKFLIKYYTDVVHGFKQSWCKHKRELPFDFCIRSLKIIIELDGRQHFEKVLNWACLDEVIKRDIYKMQKADAEGYKIIRIFQVDVYNNSEKWLEENLLPHIVSEDRSHVFISTSDDMYDEHKKMYERREDIVLNDVIEEE